MVVLETCLSCFIFFWIFFGPLVLRDGHVFFHWVMMGGKTSEVASPLDVSFRNQRQLGLLEQVW